MTSHDECCYRHLWGAMLKCMLHAPVQRLVRGLEIPFFVVEKNLPSPDIMTAILSIIALFQAFLSSDLRSKPVDSGTELVSSRARIGLHACRASVHDGVLVRMKG